MSILTRDIILKEMKSGRINIDPFDKKYLGPASYDLTLANEFRVFKKPHHIIQVENDSDYRKVTELVKTNKPFTQLSL